MTTPTQPPQIAEADEKAAESYANRYSSKMLPGGLHGYDVAAFLAGILHERKRTEEIVEVMRAALARMECGCAAGCGRCTAQKEALTKYEAMRSDGASGKLLLGARCEEAREKES